MISLELQSAGLANLVLAGSVPEPGFVVRSPLDFGNPEVRVVSIDAPDADGTIDTTRLIGPRVISVSLRLLPRTDALWQMVDRVRAFLNPQLRPTLLYTPGDATTQRMMTLRPHSFHSVVDRPTHRDVIAQWVVPNGLFESAVLHEAVAPASGVGLEAGLDFDLDFDLDFGSSPVIGSLSAVNAGNVDAYPTLRAYGPCTDPTIENITQGRSLVFDGLTIDAGEYVEVDTRAKTIRYQSDPGDSRYDDLDFPASRWWTLSPGENLLRFTPATYSPPAQLVVNWRDAWL